MNKKLSLVLVVVLALSVLTVGCGKKSDVAYKDGTYRSESQVDDRGWKSTIEIEVEEGKIVNVDYEEVNEEGLKKSEDEEYAETMKSTSGVSPAEAYEQLEEALVKSQNPEDVDAVSGATTSSETFKELAKEALK